MQKNNFSSPLSTIQNTERIPNVAGAGHTIALLTLSVHSAFWHGVAYRIAECINWVSVVFLCIPFLPYCPSFYCVLRSSANFHIPGMISLGLIWTCNAMFPSHKYNLMSDKRNPPPILFLKWNKESMVMMIYKVYFFPPCTNLCLVHIWSAKASWKKLFRFKKVGGSVGASRENEHRRERAYNQVICHW